MKKIALTTLFIFFGLISQPIVAASTFKNRLQSITMPSVTLPKMPQLLPQRLQPYKKVIQGALLVVATMSLFQNQVALYAGALPNFNKTYGLKVTERLLSKKVINKIEAAIKDRINDIWTVSLDKTTAFYQKFNAQNQAIGDPIPVNQFEIIENNNLLIWGDQPFYGFTKENLLIRNIVSNNEFQDTLTKRFKDRDLTPKDQPIFIFTAGIPDRSWYQGIVFDEAQNKFNGHNMLGVAYNEIEKEIQALHNSKAFRLRVLLSFMAQQLNPVSIFGNMRGADDPGH